MKRLRLFENFDEQRRRRPFPVRDRRMPEIEEMAGPVDDNEEPIEEPAEEVEEPSTEEVKDEKPVKEAIYGGENEIPFDPKREEDYSMLDDKDRLVVDAIFASNSLASKFHPNEGKDLIKLMPDIVEEAGYLGHGDGVGWKLTFKKGTDFETAWNTMRDHAAPADRIMKRLESPRVWGFQGFDPMEDTGIIMVNQ